ncbi:MAG: hypothetical protein K8L97_33350 [Anaerolineae bacterium]|nr:hypothetical protein [Anaerolineae bacterium]
MAMAAVSAVGTGSAVVCSGYEGDCRRVTLLSYVVRLLGKVALQIANSF